VPLPDEKQLLDDVAHARGGVKSLKSLHSLYGLKSAERVALRRMVNRLVAEGRLELLRGGQRYGLPRRRSLVEGLVAGTTQGFAFVSPDDPALPDVFIRERDLHGAMHGDRVEVALRADAEPDRPAGEVVTILERGDARIVGLFRAGRRGDPHRLLPFDARLSVPIEIPHRFAKDAEDGQYVDALLLRDAREGAREGEPLQARVVAILGRPEEPGTDVRVVLHAFRLADAHSPEALAEAEQRAATTLLPDEIARRSDLRSLPTVTIDGETARDFDDAVSIERRGDGYRLWVHIADVAAHVLEGTRLDAEALERGTSVYFPDRAVHMLPDALAAGACSLRPGEDKLTLTAILDFDAEAHVVSEELVESVIRSDRRMTYTTIKRILVDRDEALRREHADLLERFELMGELAERLIKLREARGGLDFDLPEPFVQLGPDGLVKDIVASERNVAHRVIEEFMIAANQAVARFLEREGEPGIFRNHEPPSPDKIDAFREAAAVFGLKLKGGDAPSPLDFQAILTAVEDRPEEELLTTLTLRSMSLARYESERRGHYGLALTHYAHFTSPIRRYPDLAVHRAVRRRLRGARLSEDDAAELRADLGEVAEQCSKAERNAEAAERALLQWKKCAFMSSRVGEVFAGRITGITEKGLFVMLMPHHVEGFVTWQGLEEDWYERDQGGLRVVGERTRRVLRLGDPLDVAITEVDMYRRRITLAEHIE